MKSQRDSVKLLIHRTLGLLYIAFSLLPSAFAQPRVVTVLFVLVWIAFGINFITRKHSKIVKWISAYILISISIYLFLGLGDIHIVVSKIKLLTLCLLCEHLYKSDKRFLINMLTTILAIFILINFVTLIIAPDGLYIESTFVNEWYSFDYRGWFLGQSNNQALYFLLLLVLMSYKSSGSTMVKSMYLHKLFVFFISVISIISVLVLNSSTTSFCIILAIVASFVVELFKKVNISWSPNVLTVVIFIAAFEILILIGHTSFLEPVVSFLFGKTTSFTNRAALWEMCLLQIAAKPFWGYGYIPGDTMREIMGAYAYVNAHNQFLQTLLEGGIILLVPLIGILMTVIKSANICNDSNNKLYMEIIFVCLIVHMTFEINFGALSIILYFLMFHYSTRFMQREPSTVKSNTQVKNIMSERNKINNKRNMSCVL